MRKSTPKNVLMNDGTGRRVPGDQAEALIDSGQARRYISKTIYRALRLGIEIKNYDDRDEKGALRARIKEFRTKAEAVRHKAETKKKKRQKEQAAQEDAQAVLDDD